MNPAPIRCPAPHPVYREQTCNAWLLNAVPSSVEVRKGRHPAPGCIEVRCPRCGERYIVCAGRHN